MSYYPFLFPYHGPSHLLGQDFGLELNPEELFYLLGRQPRNTRQLTRSQSLQTSVKADPNKFQVCLDVHQFAPHEIVVKTIGRQIVVEGKHEEREDEHGYIARHFVRKYTVPEGHEPNEVSSTISSDGILTVTAPRDPIILPDKNERIVPISHTGPAHREVREHSVEHLPEARSKIVVCAKRDCPPLPLAIKYL